MSRFPDEWGTALGEDPDKPQTPKQRPKKKYDPDSRTALVLYFNQKIPTNMKRIGANVNGPVMMKSFANLAQRGFTPSDIRGMIDAFVKTITRKPLPVHIAPWRAFLADIDKYADQVRRAPTREENDDVEIDPRLQ